ncbi:transketolase [Hyaloraphidium curvatum]|nr:transketolase [Hyaloraphidium curvatum]
MASLDTPALARAAAEARGLAMDAVHKCASGHLGLPLGCAEMGAVLFGSNALRFDPAAPKWLGRDRFILSAGHGSMFIYAWLHLAGYDLSLDDVKAFRQLHSKTPGHPEQFEDTPGIEATTGPLGQGVANGVGYAVSGKMAAAKFGPLFDHRVVVLAGDGCMQEGVALEAISFAGHAKLDNLVLIYDSNDVTLDAMADATQDDDAAMRFEALRWHVQTIDGHDMAAFAAALDKTKEVKGKPHIIIAKTTIGKGIPEVAGTQKAHGEGGAKFVDAARKALGLPEDHFYVSKETRDFFGKLKATRTAEREAWDAEYAKWKAGNAELAAVLENRDKVDVAALLKAIPEFPADAKIATRKAGSDALQPVAEALPLLIGGSADLYGSTLNYINSSKDWTPTNWGGRNIRFGIREHAMCSIMNGIAYDGVFRPSGATFLVFADYCRPAIRLAALSHLPVIYIFTHDSVGVGEDGPTHQPVETVSGLRVIPNLDVVRPADPEETAGAFAHAAARLTGPTLIALTRQVVPNLSFDPASVRRDGVLKGAYVLVKEQADLQVILLASGSEVQHAVAAAKELGPGARVVSVPCFEAFDRESAEYREQVLPSACRKRVAIEAGVSLAWYKYVGLDGKVVAIDRFGISAPGGKVMEELGMTAAKVVEAAKLL